jgi:hypothetical protein
MTIKHFFYYHQRFLPTNHKYRKSINDFFIGRVEKDVAPPYLSGEELYDMVSQYDDIVFGFQSGKQNIFNTVMNVKGKTKSNIKSRMNIALFCHCKNMELIYAGSRVVKPKASFALDKNA